MRGATAGTDSLQDPKSQLSNSQKSLRALGQTLRGWTGGRGAAVCFRQGSWNDIRGLVWNSPALWSDLADTCPSGMSIRLLRSQPDTLTSLMLQPGAASSPSSKCIGPSRLLGCPFLGWFPPSFHIYYEGLPISGRVKGSCHGPSYVCCPFVQIKDPPFLSWGCIFWHMASAYV